MLPANLGPIVRLMPKVLMPIRPANGDFSWESFSAVTELFENFPPVLLNGSLIASEVSFRGYSFILLLVFICGSPPFSLNGVLFIFLFIIGDPKLSIPTFKVPVIP